MVRYIAREREETINILGCSIESPSVNKYLAIKVRKPQNPQTSNNLFINNSLRSQMNVHVHV